MEPRAVTFGKITPTQKWQQEPCEWRLVMPDAERADALANELVTLTLRESVNALQWPTSPALVDESLRAMRGEAVGFSALNVAFCVLWSCGIVSAQALARVAKNDLDGSDYAALQARAAELDGGGGGSTK